MFRILITILIPLLLPTLAYLLYVGLAGRKRAAPGPAADGEGTEGDGTEGAVGNAPRRSWVDDTPWVWLIGSGVLLMAVLLVTLALTGGVDRDMVYIPAHVGPDGQHVPARSVPRDQLPR